MELIDIRKIKTVFICPDHNDKYKERCKYMFELLRDLGFEKIIHYKSGAQDTNERYPLNNATYNVLQMSMDEPVLILEDDLEFVPNPAFVFEIEKDVDALYLGMCHCDYNFEKKSNGNKADFEVMNSNYVRIKNMTSAHAILYLSPTYKQYIGNQLRYTDDANDVEICKHQAKFNVLGLRKPICWQSMKHNNGWKWIEYATKIQIDDGGFAHDLVT